MNIAMHVQYQIELTGASVYIFIEYSFIFIAANIFIE